MYLGFGGCTLSTNGFPWFWSPTQASVWAIHFAAVVIPPLLRPLDFYLSVPVFSRLNQGIIPILLPTTLLRMNCDGFHRSILNTRILLESIPSFELFFNALFYLGRTSSNIVNATTFTLGPILRYYGYFAATAHHSRGYDSLYLLQYPNTDLTYTLPNL